MAEITPTIINPGAPSAQTYTWSNVGDADTCEPFVPWYGRALGGAMQVTGTFGGATVALEGSNDGGTSWAAIWDLKTNAAASLAAATAAAEFSTAMQLIRPVPTGGTGRDLTIIVTLVG